MVRLILKHWKSNVLLGVTYVLYPYR